MATSPQVVGGGHSQVLLVVPRGREPVSDRPAEPHDVAGPLAGGAERLKGIVGDIAQLPVSGHQGRFGGRVQGHRLKEAGPLGDRGPHRDGDHRCGHRPPAGARQLRSAEELGQAVRRQKGDRAEAHAAPAHGPRAPDVSSRRAATPTWLEGTTTVTGARGIIPHGVGEKDPSASAACRP